MMTVNEVSKLTKVSIRTLQYYDKIGLLKPTAHTKSGYRLYDDTALEKLQQILLFRELEFSLKEIKTILSRTDFDRNKALEQQIVLLTMKKEHLENLINFAREIKLKGENTMDFSAFDTSKIEEYEKSAKERWGDSCAYREYEEKSRNRTKEEEQTVMKQLMQIFAEFGKMKNQSPDSEEVKKQVRKLQNYITEHYYPCSEEMLRCLGTMYEQEREFAGSINRAGGEGTAEFTAEAIRRCCGQ